MMNEEKHNYTIDSTFADGDEWQEEKKTDT